MGETPVKILAVNAYPLHFVLFAYSLFITCTLEISLTKFSHESSLRQLLQNNQGKKNLALGLAKCLRKSWHLLKIQSVLISLEQVA